MTDHPRNNILSLFGNRKVLLAFAAALVCIMLCYGLRARNLFEYQTDALPPYRTMALLEEATITQEVSGRSASVCGIAIQFDRYGEANDTSVRVTFSVNDETAGEWSVREDNLVMHVYHTFRLDKPVTIQPVDHCVIRLESGGSVVQSLCVYGSSVGSGLRYTADGDNSPGSLCYRLVCKDVVSVRYFFVVVLLCACLLLVAAMLLVQERVLSVKTWLAIIAGGISIVLLVTGDLLFSDRIGTDIAMPVRAPATGTHYLEPAETWVNTVDTGMNDVDSILVFPDAEDASLLEKLHVRLEHTGSGTVFLDRTVNITEFVSDGIRNEPVLRWNASDLGAPGGVFPAGEYRITLINRAHQLVRFQVAREETQDEATAPLYTEYRIRSYIRYGMIACCLLLLSVYVLLLSYFLWRRQLTPERFFLVSAVTFICISLIAISPSYVSDADAHFSAAYRFTNLFTGIRGEAANQGRADDVYYYDNLFWNGSTPTTLLGATPFVKNAERQPFLDTSARTYGYSVFCYLPQVLGMLLGMLLRLGTVPMLYLGRIAIAVTYIAAFYHAIKTTPVGKHLFICMALYPGTLIACTSFSYDAMVLITTVNFMACVFRLYREPDSVRWMFETMLFAFAVGAVKAGGYLILLPLVLMLSLKDKKRILMQAGIVMAGLVSLVLFDVILATGRLYQFGSGEAGFYTAEYAYTHPLHYLEMVIRTYAGDPDGLFLTTAGGGRFRGEPVADIVICGLLLVTILYGLFEKDSIKLKKKDRDVLLLVLGLFLILIPGMMLKDTYDWAETISTIQGRYYLPAIPLLMLLFTKFQIRDAMDVLSEERSKRMLQNCYLWHVLLMLVSSYYVIRMVRI